MKKILIKALFIIENLLFKIRKQLSFLVQCQSGRKGGRGGSFSPRLETRPQPRSRFVPSVTGQALPGGLSVPPVSTTLRPPTPAPSGRQERPAHLDAGGHVSSSGGKPRRPTDAQRPGPWRMFRPCGMSLYFLEHAEFIVIGFPLPCSPSIIQVTEK